MCRKHKRSGMNLLLTNGYGDYLIILCLYRDQLRKCISAWEKYEETVKSAQNWLQNTDVTVKAEKIAHEGQVSRW